MTLSASHRLPLGSFNRQLYGRLVLALLAVSLLAAVTKFAGLTLQMREGRFAVDFHAFYVAAQLAWTGHLDQAYHFATMGPLESAITGKEIFLPWSYPPHFALVIAPLAKLPLTAAYIVFTTVTLIAYLSTLHRLAGVHFTAAALTILPALIMTTACGQNGFLTGTLIALSCLGFLKGKPLAGVPMGLMIIKPHLAVGIGIFTLLTWRWKTAAVAVLVIAIATAGVMLAFGPSIWAAFLHGMHETRVFLEAGLYPLHRMISLYAALRGFGLPAGVAFAGQALAAVTSLALMWAAVRRKMVISQQLGVAIVGSLLLSPYAYDYDLTIYGVGFALLLPCLLRLASEWEQRLIFGLSFFTAAWGLASSAVLEAQFGDNLPEHYLPNSLAGLTLFACLILIWRVLRRDYVWSKSPDGAPPVVEPAAA